MYHEAVERGVSWSIYTNEGKYLLHNLSVWKAKAIAAILNAERYADHYPKGA